MFEGLTAEEGLLARDPAWEWTNVREVYFDRTPLLAGDRPG